MKKLVNYIVDPSTPKVIKWLTLFVLHLIFIVPLVIWFGLKEYFEFLCSDIQAVKRSLYRSHINTTV